ncbi:unnamed protein product [Rotaria sordida]|uniref:Phospholipase A2 n=1 Tax=Rotaria sordida TaxID=392033 RepID=A0A814NY16_9BILA|nr:unnamed protein product [Rotaria sordida]CAF1090296.1 unnamed protein product [Rotaria sordida]CAF1097376.1 unnamed protein product [Rotaria sordida]CAF1158926.1 unnamed protein product [Rotaria sordida]CAF1317315.1 unnamed protein product [Rotaria sordida]
MINYKGFSSLDYIGYGCWCGLGTYGSKVFDSTDRCCQLHDQCYDRISGGFFGCSPKLVTYDWKGLFNGEIQCTDRENTCDRNACDCDRVAVECYSQYRSTYNPDFLDGKYKGNKKIACK